VVLQDNYETGKKRGKGEEDVPEAFVMDPEGEALLNKAKKRLPLHLRRFPRVGGERIAREGISMLLFLEQGWTIRVFLPSLLCLFLFGRGRRRGGRRGDRDRGKLADTHSLLLLPL